MKELMKFIGMSGLVNLGGLMVEVEVKDIKMSYGKIRYQIAPVKGDGLIWVETVNFFKDQVLNDLHKI